EVVQASVGAEILADAGPGGNGERNILAAGDGHAVIAGGCAAAAEVGGIIQAVGVGPVIGEQSDGVGDDGGRSVRSGVAAAAPEGISGAAVVVALDVDGILGGDGE